MLMVPETATGLEAARTAIAACGALAALLALYFAVHDYWLLRRDGVDGPTSIVYAQKIVGAAISLIVQVTYTVVGVAAMLAPAPLPAEGAVATYLLIAVRGSALVSSVVLAGSLWQFATRHLLLRELRRQITQAGQAPEFRRREEEADRRTVVADDRTQVADNRVEAADARAGIADLRDQVADRRDRVAGQRDRVAGQRDDAADRRDEASERPSSGEPPGVA